ncbi:AraC family transcriptional regulator [Pelagicoccus mobilis]|uniref:DNA-binding transcriptional regulator n=1 Tax=Pelagicoccus mobilis TaxID=415221 RepID=A0A934S1U3_9BACT|nr:DNA-binding transcriptional regulator [Pelagicoccus mobilis]MBK1879061.1 DNA-binding transcriptional regulator [Pelagicoccus mobilis]
MKPLKQIAILIETSSGWGRRLIEGILSEANKHHRWHNWVSPEKPEHGSFFLPKSWEGDGIIAMLDSRKTARRLERYGVPIVDVSDIMVPDQPHPQVMTDHMETARLALEHLLAKGFKRFGYVGATMRPGVREQHQAFRRVARSLGIKHELLSMQPDYSSLESWQDWSQSVVDWLNEQPKPIAVVTWNAPIGREVIDACRMAGILVPHEVAVIASNTDDLLDNACDPRLTAVEDAGIQIGKLAASYLDKLMEGETDLPSLAKVKPTRVILGGSTDTLAVDDPQLEQALRYIDEHALEEGINVSKILKHVPMARRALEMKFNQALGHSPGEEIRRRKLSKAKDLLVETKHTMYEIAEICGYSSYTYLHKAFKKATDLSPSQYRRQWSLEQGHQRSDLE